MDLFLNHANLINEVAFPTWTLLTIVPLSVTLDFALIFVVLLLFLLTAEHRPGLNLLAMALLLALQLWLSLGLGMLAAVLNVFIRDLKPCHRDRAKALVLADIDRLPVEHPARLGTILGLNPMTLLVKAYQTILLIGQRPDWCSLWLPGLWSAVVAVSRPCSAPTKA